MATFVGPLFLLARLAGFTLLFVTMIGMVVYFLARRNEHPNGWWTLRAVLGYGGAFCAAIGLITGSVSTLGLGMILWIASLFVDRGPVPPPPVV